MKVCRVEVERFLCFQQLRVDLDPRLQLIAGPNNAGKSSLIRLIEAFFADPSGEELVELLPLHAYYGALGTRTLSTIQLWFTDFTHEERETFGPIIRRDNRMSLTLRCGRSGSVTYRASRGVSAEESVQFYRQAVERFHFVKIPSVRVGGAGDRSEPESLERLLDTLEAILIRRGSSRSTTLQREFANRIETVDDLVRSVLNESAEAITGDLPFQEQRVAFQLPDARFALRGMLGAAVIESHGDVQVPVASRGTGFQSALVLGILRYVASREAQTEGNLFFAIEEPEAFLHPQTQRAIAKIIRAISSDAQVLVTTHSSVLVDSFDLRRIARLPLQVGGTIHNWIAPALEPADEGRLSRYCSAANSELIFANAVIFVEGEGDQSVVEKLLARACDAPGGHYALGVTVITATGLGKVKYLVQLAELFGVRSYVLADIDGLRRRGGQRVLLTVLGERAVPTRDDVKAALIAEADQSSTDLAAALARQNALNELLQTVDGFVLSSDLEGLLLDMYGDDGLITALGPGGEGEIGEQLVVQLGQAGDKYEALASWLGSRGWNSDRQTSGKMAPHLAPVLIDRWFEANVEPGQVLAPLVTWLEGILASAAPTPV